MLTILVGLFGLKGVLREYRIVEEAGLALRTRSVAFGLNFNVALEYYCFLENVESFEKF